MPNVSLAVSFRRGDCHRGRSRVREPRRHRAYVCPHDVRLKATSTAAEHDLHVVVSSSEVELWCVDLARVAAVIVIVCIGLSSRGSPASTLVDFGVGMSKLWRLSWLFLSRRSAGSRV